MIAIALQQIPPEGKQLEGEEDADFLDLEEIGSVSAGPVRYRLDVGISEGGVFATGQLSVSVEMTCVACLQRFVYEAVVDPFVAQVEIEGQERIDLTPLAREELLLALPNHPRCDLNNDHSCPYHGHTSSGGGSQVVADSAWDQLDKLKPKR